MLRKQWRKLFAVLMSALLVGTALAATERFDYDPLGRLIRVLNDATQATEYSYDAAGNLLEVRTNVSAAAPVISGITPASLRRGDTKPVTITGSGFIGSSVAVTDPALGLRNLQITATQIKFDLTAPHDATTGPQTVTVSSAAGKASASITVAPLLPKTHVDPAPLAIPPDNTTRQFTIRLSHADAIDHVINLAAANTKIVVSPASVTIPAGQLSVAATITGVSAGQSAINISSATLGNTSVPVFVTTEFVGISTSLAKNLGVVVETPPQQKTSQVGPVAGRALGVVVGSIIRGITPDKIAIGTESGTLTIQGTGLETAQTVSIEPATGVTLGAPVVAADGATVTVPVNVAADAPITQRRVIVKNGAGVAFAAASPSADRIDIVRLAPEIHSIDPLFGKPNTTVNLTVRGRNLQGAQAISFSPTSGLTADALPTVNADGTILTARVAIGMAAATGEYVVTVTTPGGTSDSTPSAANTLKVVNEIQGTVEPIVAPVLGVMVGTPSDNAPPPQPIGLLAPATGVVLGPVVLSMDPMLGIIGTDMTLTIRGEELHGASQLQFSPADGLTVGSVAVAADGKSVTVPVTIASGAPRTIRKARLLAGSAEIPFANLAASQFRVSLPLPEIDSITPITLQTGQPAVALLIRGRNFTNATAVKLTPADGMTVTAPPVVNSSGTEVTVNISAAAAAATGQRLVSVLTPAGESSATLGANNTLTLSSQAGTTYSPLVSPVLGVVRQSDENEPPPTKPVGPVASPLLGVQLQAEAAPPASTSSTQYANRLGVALGATALALDASGFVPGFNGTLTISGRELGSVTAVNIVPAQGIVFGTPAPSEDGSRLSVPMTVDAAAARGARNLTLHTAAGTVAFADPAASQLRVGPGVPRIDSITPILAYQGELVNMVIRGANFQDALAVTATADAGITFVPGTLAVSADGTELKVNFTIDANAPVGSRVIRVEVPGAGSSAEPVPANTFTVYAK